MSADPPIRGGVEPVPDSASFAARLARIAEGGPVPSPCVNICRIDSFTDTCEGCRRTLAEIAAWGAMGDADRLAVWTQLPGREPPV